MANTQVCGMQCAEWSFNDQVCANAQRDAKVALEAKAENSSAVEDMRQMMNRIWSEEQVKRDRTVMTNARKFHPRHRSINNANLATELFGIEGWNSACALCKKLGFDPKSIRCEVVENGK